MPGQVLSRFKKLIRVDAQRDITSDFVHVFVDATCLLLLVQFALLDELFDELSSLLNIALALLLQLAQLVAHHDHVVAGLLCITRRLLAQVLHGGEVLRTPLVLQLVDGQFDLCGRVLLLLDELLVHVLLVHFLQSCLTEALKQGVVCLFAQGGHDLRLNIFDITLHFTHSCVNFGLKSIQTPLLIASCLLQCCKCLIHLFSVCLACDLVSQAMEVDPVYFLRAFCYLAG